MPRIVDKFSKDQSFLTCQHAQSAILDLYRLDLAKYAKKQQYKNLHILFDRIPEFVGQHFKYSKIDAESSNPSRDYKNALHKLELARLIHTVSATHANGLPLRAEIDSSKFKIFFLFPSTLSLDFHNCYLRLCKRKIDILVASPLQLKTFLANIVVNNN